MACTGGDVTVTGGAGAVSTGAVDAGGGGECCRALWASSESDDMTISCFTAFSGCLERTFIVEGAGSACGTAEYIE